MPFSTSKVSMTSSSSSSSSTSSSLHFFTTPISLKLSKENFLLWKQHVLATIDDLLLSKFLDGTQVSPSIIPTADGFSTCNNHAFTIYRQQDSLLVAWMLASMTTPFLTKMMGLQSSAQIWDVFHTYFAANTYAQIKKFRLRLKNPKNECSVTTYLLGAPVFVEDHVETILDGLSTKFDSFVASIMSRKESYTINEIEALLLAQEERFVKHHQVDHLTISPSTNVATWTPTRSTTSKFQRKPGSSRGGHNFMHASSNQGSRHSNYKPTHTESWNSRNSSRCQICKKLGLSAEFCWQRYTPSSSNNMHANFSSLSTLNYVPSEASILGAPSNVEDPLWYPDSGATHHITNSPSIYSDKQSYEKINNGKDLCISHIDSAFISYAINNTSFRLNDFLLVPDITKNLLSVSKFSHDNNVFFVFVS